MIQYDHHRTSASHADTITLKFSEYFGMQTHYHNRPKCKRNNNLDISLDLRMWLKSYIKLVFRKNVML